MYMYIAYSSLFKAIYIIFNKYLLIDIFLLLCTQLNKYSAFVG